MKMIMKCNIFIISCFVSMHLLFGGGASGQKNEIIGKNKEEGWRLCQGFVIEYLVPDGCIEKHDFEEEHRDLETIATRLSYEERNIALVQISLMVEKDNQTKKLLLKDFPYVIKEISVEKQAVQAGMSKKKKEMAKFRLIFQSGQTENEQGIIRDVNVENLPCLRVIASLPVSRQKLELELMRRLGNDFEGSFLEHSEAHAKIIDDIEKLKIKEFEGSIPHTVDRLRDLDSARKCIDVFEQLQYSYLDSEQLLIRKLHEPRYQNQFCEVYYELKMREKFDRVKGIVMNLYTQRNPCNVCGPALFRECERSDGLAKKYQRLIAARQGQYSPFFLLMVSCSQYHKRDSGSASRPSLFFGIEHPRDGEVPGPRSGPIDPERFAPFYPLVFLERKVEGAAGEDHGGPANQSTEMQKLLKDFELERFFCDTPEELNRRKVMQFCQEHGGIRTWRDVIVRQGGYIGGSGVAAASQSY